MYNVDSDVYTVHMKPASTRERILMAARRLLDERGSEGITMRRVAKAVGLTPMAVYRHFADRDGLLNALADQGFRQLAVLLQDASEAGAPERRLLKLSEVYLDHALENPRLFELMFLLPRSGARRFPPDFRKGASPTANVLATVIQQGMDEGKFHDEDIWQVVFEIGALSHGLIMLYLGGRIALSVPAFKRLYRRSFRRFIRAIRK